MAEEEKPIETPITPETQNAPENPIETLSGHLHTLAAVHVNVQLFLDLILKVMQPKPGMEGVVEFMEKMADIKEEDVKQLVSELKDGDKNVKGVAGLIVTKHSKPVKPEAKDDVVIGSLNGDGGNDAAKLHSFLSGLK